MNSKERVLTSLNHEEPDRAPKYLFTTPEVFEKLVKALGIDVHEDPYIFDVELENDLMLCYRGISNIPGILREKCKENEKELLIDNWGIGYKLIHYGKDESSGSYLEMVSHPLSNIKDYDNFKIPNPYVNEDYIEHKNLVKKYGKEYAIIAGVATTVFEASWYLRGLDNLLIDMIENQDFVIDLMKKVADYHLKVAKEMVEIGADILWLGDDVGMQNSMLISPEQYRKFLKPIYAYLISEVKKVNKNIKIAYHTDGYVEPVIKDFIEIGIDIYQAVQPSCINTNELKKKYGKNLAFWGAVDVQNVMPFGSAGDVINEVRTRISDLAEGGGYILCTAHCVQPSIRSVDNIFTYYWAANRFGKYPIKF